MSCITGSLDAILRSFLDDHPAHHEGRDDWPLDPVAPLRVRLCQASSLPPVAWRSSILGIVVLPDETVLFLQPTEPTGAIAHVLVGGRPEQGEAPEETLRREAAEETGWLVEPKAVVGFRHFHHLGPPHPRLTDRPYPDFLQAVYAATATRFDSSALLPGEIPCEPVDARWAVAVTEPAQRPLLRAALRACLDESG
jgi:8-oxo-dGTP pyrophosphatase MutT (NUDIX family)